MNRRKIMVSLVVLVAAGIFILSRTKSANESDTDAPDSSESAATASASDVETQQPVAPGVATLVGRDVCKECHAENYDLHAEHGHAHTFRLASDPEVVSKFAGKTFDSGEPYGTYKYFSTAERPLYATLPEKFGDEPFPLQYALGSGHNAFTLMTLVPAVQGEGTAGIEHRASWYAKTDSLGITPGHAEKSPHEGLEFFGDTAQGEPLAKCISCHTTSATIVGQQIGDLIPSVNCEKCHGPGSEHVRQARASNNPPPFSVGRDDWDTESELQLCGDCHRLPRNISEKELREYPDLLARFQPVGMLRSRCYLESGGALKCTTCHSPHTSIKASSDAEQVKNCVACHLENSDAHVACPVSPTEGCIECHMPTIEQDQGLKFHDHWIRVQE